MESALPLIDDLRRVHRLHFEARTAGLTGWNGRGIGEVEVELPEPNVIVFHESGIWNPTQGRELRFHNVYRWSSAGDQVVRLEHLRFGPDRPVHLFDLVSESEQVWSSINSHLCGEDAYSAWLRRNEGGILLRWSVGGPRKQEHIDYTYRFGGIR